MLIKEPRKLGLSTKAKIVIGIAAASEVAFVIVTYIGYKRMNRDQDFRKRVYTQLPWFSKLYYDIDELLPKDKTRKQTLRQQDHAAWGVSESLK